MRELVRHLSMIHLCAAVHVTKPHHDNPWFDDLAELAIFWPEDSDLIDWYLETNANLVQSLESASPDDDLPTFLPAPSPLAIWARRQVHETAIHRFDAQKAAGTTTEIDPTFASDSIDELLSAFAPRASTFPIDDTKMMAVRTADTDVYWRVTMRPNGVTTVRDDGPADITLSGKAADVYLALWNRGNNPDLTVAGNNRVLVAWHHGHRVRWD